MNEDLRRRLEKLVDRGEPRGAEAVLAAARRQAADLPARRPLALAAAAIAAAVLFVLGVTALPERQGGPPAALLPTVDLGDAQLVRYSSCDALVDDMRRAALDAVTPYGVLWLAGVADVRDDVTFGDRRLGREGSASPTTTAVMVPDTGGAPTTFSQTNTQETGIDEPDIVDTDGRRLLALRDDRLWYATVEGADVRIEDSVELVDARSLVLVGDRAVVFGDRRRGAVQSSTITVVDVRTPAMRVLSSLTFDGAHVSARVVDGVVRAVVRSVPTGFPWRYPTGASPEDEQAALRHNRELVRTATREQWLPSLRIEDGAGRVRGEKALVDCDSTFRPQTFGGFGMLTVLTLDPTNPDNAQSTTVQADGDTVYAARERLYVGTTTWDANPGRLVGEGMTETLVHAFDIGGRGQARYLGSGRVPGATVGQFAFSEHDGHLRVASTVNAWNPATSESYVTVLRHNGDVLEQVGQVGGLGRTESIEAVRFIGTVGYVVTFRRTDPLYVVDLRDPRAPRVAGELKVPGYSSYLHPIGPDLLLGVGQDATAEGRTTGLQLSVFDVSDPAQPTRLHQHAFALRSGSTAEVDHHAFLWWAPRQLVVVPVAEAGDGKGGSAVGVSAGRDKLREVGRLEHPGGTRIDRSVVVGTTLFTFSHAGILAADVATLAAGKWVAYPA